MRARRIATGILFALALVASYALKRHYSAASADDLRWVLAPTTSVVELVTGEEFPFERGAGYVSTRLMYAIAPSCAGVNFSIVAFCALVFGFVRPGRSVGRNVGIFVGAAAAAYATTIVANAIRIAIAIPLHVNQVSWGWFTGERLHVIVGVVVYLSMLLALFLAARRLAGARVAAWVPLVPYVVVALLVPLANGSWARAAFWEHAAIVLALIAVGVGGHRVLTRSRA
jgi:exosortase K